MVSRTVLLVGMDGACAEWLESSLVRRGYRVLQARNQHDAYERLSDPEGIDVILADPGTEPGFEGVSDASHLVKGTVVPLLFTLTTEQMPCVDRIGAAGQSGYLPMECGEALIDAGIQAACAARKRLGALSSEDEELRKARLIVENIPTGLYIYHLENLEDDHSLRMVYANPAVGPLTGLWPGDIVGKTLDENFPGLRAQGMPERFAEVVRRQKADEFDSIVYQDARVPEAAFLVKAFPLPGDPVGVAFENITARKKAEEALRENEERLRETSRIAKVGGWEIDLEGNILAWTEEIYRIFELDGELPPSLDDALLFYHEEDRGRVKQAVADAILNGENFDFESRLVTAKGNLRWVRAIGSVQYRDGKPVGVRGMQQDVTDRKMAEEEQARLQVQLAQVQKLDSIGRLAGGVAHDFNNMLGVILGHAEMALQDIDENNPLRSDIKGIMQAAEHSAELTRQLLAFARKQTIAPRVVDLNQTVASMLSMIKRIIGENIDLEWIPTDRNVFVKIDPSQVDQILANLCINARDAIERTGRITIETEAVSFDEEYCKLLEGIRPGHYVKLSVSDDGCGMDREILAKVFEPFFTTKELGRGTGLGLATVYGILKQNKGQINIYSEPGRGTTVKMYLPEYRDDPVQDLQGDSLDTGRRSVGSVLLVEDSRINLEVTTRMLGVLGHEVVSTQSPEEALKIVTEKTRHFDVLLTDVVMPGMNGRDLSRLIGETSPGIACVFMSGYTANVIAHQGILDENVFFLQKPFSMWQLEKSMQTAMNRKALQ